MYTDVDRVYPRYNYHRAFALHPGLILIASITVLYYSIAILPAYFIDRFFGKRLLAMVVAAVSVVAAALLPHYVDGYLLGRLVAADHSDPASFQPRSFELPYPELDNYWTNWRRPESRRSPPPAHARISVSNCCSGAMSIRLSSVITRVRCRMAPWSSDRSEPFD